LTPSGEGTAASITRDAVGRRNGGTPDPVGRRHVGTLGTGPRIVSAVATTPPAAAFDALLRRMYHRDGLDALPEHLAGAHRIAARSITELDVGVFRVDRADGGPVVVRVFSGERPLADAEADLAVLRHLAGLGFPAERPFDGAPLSELRGQPVLATGFVRGAPKSRQPRYPIVRLGARIARLHQLDPPPGAARPAGALHHFADGTLSDELRAAVTWLDSIEDRVPGDARGGLDTLRSALRDADGGDGLPEAFVHPDPVPKNAIFTADGPVLVDWTASGRGPRLPSMTLVLRSGWAATPFLKGYTRHVTLTAEERERLGGLLVSRALIDRAFRVCRAPETMTATADRLPALRRTATGHARAVLAEVFPDGG
jgi:Ser/Thr protein kinase RdoA (MazF antagonist)